MKRVLGCLLMVVAGAVVLGTIPALVIFGEAWEHRSVCNAQYETIEAAMKSVNLLDATPPGAVPDQELYRSCTDPDDHHATISRYYSLTGQHRSPEDIQSFYRDLALLNGWELVSAGDPDDEPSCILKGTLNFEVSFPSELKDTYSVSVSTWPC
ncbi:hypothetical protein [Planobispora rosea]|uniref:hypothetical protein n=1 Tax=Planobispora rosea TaxID=35762 RepID=UPI00114CFA5A|nr:hypothetical protein [Planobispora rosea]